MNKHKDITKDQYRGCLLGLAFGDAIGAHFEGGFLERGLWAVIGRSKGRMKYTDDTQMALDIIRSILHCGRVDQDHMAAQFASSYKWSRGYGPGAAELLKKIKKGADWRQANRSQFIDGSYGNGAAMRSPVLPLFFSDKDELLRAVKQTSEITHAHPSGIEGAQLVALATYYALRQENPEKIIPNLLDSAQQSVFIQKLMQLKKLVETKETLNCKETVKLFGHGIAAADSCMTAIFAAFQFLQESYQDMIEFICQCGGDTDTISAMAGGIWGAYHGYEAMSQLKVDTLELGETMVVLADKVFDKRPIQ